MSFNDLTSSCSFSSRRQINLAFIPYLRYTVLDRVVPDTNSYNNFLPSIFQAPFREKRFRKKERNSRDFELLSFPNLTIEQKLHLINCSRVGFANRTVKTVLKRNMTKRLYREKISGIPLSDDRRENDGRRIERRSKRKEKKENNRRWYWRRRVGEVYSPRGIYKWVGRAKISSWWR